MPKIEAFIGLGSNLGDSRDYLKKAKTKISELDSTAIIEESTIIRTKPYGVTDQPDFLNQVIKIETEFSPEILLEKLLKIERALDRKRLRKWGPRTIDLDILFYGNKIVDSENLTIPHPEIHKRNFVLKSLLELCPEFIHPKLNSSIINIHRNLNEK